MHFPYNIFTGYSLAFVTGVYYDIATDVTSMTFINSDEFWQVYEAIKVADDEEVLREFNYRKDTSLDAITVDDAALICKYHKEKILYFCLHFVSCSRFKFVGGSCSLCIYLPSIRKVGVSII